MTDQNSIVYDSVTDEITLALDSCIPNGELWENQNLQGLTISGPLALVDAASCPDSLDKTQTQFDNYFKSKIAIFVGSPKVEEACEKGIGEFTDWAARLTAAGAAGVVYLSPVVNRIPGIWYSTYTTGRALASDTLGPLVRNNATLVPFLHCAVTDTGLPGVSDDAQLQDFLDSRMTPLVDRIAAMESSTMMMNVTVESNTWIDMYESPLYIATFFYIFPILLLSCACLGTYYMGVRISRSVAFLKRQNPNGSADVMHNLKEIVNVPLGALFIESLQAFFLAVFLIGDGNWAVVDGPFFGWRDLFNAQLLLTSMSSSVLVGLSFNDFRKLSKKLSLQKNGSFMVRHRYLLVAWAFVLIILEVVLSQLRGISEDAFLIGNGVAIFIFSIITGWFLYTAWSFTSVLKGLSKKSSTAGNTTNGGTTGGKGNNTAMQRIVRHNQKWATLAGLSFLLNMITALVLNFSTLAFRSDSSAIGWTLMYAARTAGIFFKIKIVMPQARRSSNETNNYTVDTQGDTKGSRNGSFALSNHQVASHAALATSARDDFSYAGPAPAIENETSFSL